MWRKIRSPPRTTSHGPALTGGADCIPRHASALRAICGQAMRKLRPSNGYRPADEQGVGLYLAAESIGGPTVRPSRGGILASSNTPHHQHGPALAPACCGVFYATVPAPLPA